MLNIATVFSGIGAFEVALSQLGISHKILFACDNGERELAFPSNVIADLSHNLDDAQTKLFVESLLPSKDKDNKAKYKALYEELYDSKHSKKSIELTVEAINILTEGKNHEEKEQFVNSLYEQTGKCNFVKLSYLGNFKLSEKNWHEDIRFLEGSPYRGKLDILVGGSPCQSFSTYGKKRGLEDTRGTLFYDYARIIQESQPKVFIYENVQNVLKNDKGRTWEIMKEVWDTLGYELYYDILNAQDYGTPQLRRRLFLIGFRKDVIKGKTYHFPEKQELTRFAPSYLDTKVDKKYYLGKKGFEWVTTPSKNLRRSRYNQDIIGCQTANQQDNWIGDFRIEPVQEWMRKEPKIYICSLDGVEVVARKMTPQECLRLMGFKNFKQVVEDKHMYRQAGNSIVVTVLEALIKTIMPIIRK